jgi:hypothetical protein
MHHLDTWYHAVVLPAKRQLDAEYMARATFSSDLRLIVNTIFRRWDSSVLDTLLNTAAFGAEDRKPRSRASDSEPASTRVPMQPGVERPTPAAQSATY